MYRLYANTALSYVRDLSILGSYYLQGILEPVPRDTEEGLYTLLKHTHLFIRPQDSVQALSGAHKVLHVPSTHPLISSPDIPLLGQSGQIVATCNGQKDRGVSFPWNPGHLPERPLGIWFCESLDLHLN